MKLELGRQQKSNHSQNPGFALFAVVSLLFISIVAIRFTEMQRGKEEAGILGGSGSGQQRNRR